ncbi:MAG: hypothetical protein LBV39_03965 [Bacteroidales bacterium]|jgi:hypothetical protein|nr:hypothetical protein [Bacteroidales bacterium]
MLFFNLPSARQKKRKVRKDLDKRLLAQERELQKVHRLIRNLGYEDLAVPYQQGWKRHFVLRDDVAQSARASFFAEILAKINVVQFSSRKDFKKKRRRRGRSGYIVREQYLQTPALRAFQEMKFTEEEVGWFQEETYFCPFGKCQRIRYVFREPWRFVLKTEPNMITKRHRIDLNLERRKQELDYIYRYPTRARLDWLSGRTWYSWYYREDPRLPENPFKNKSFNQVIEELFSQDIKIESFL